jgi:UDP-N-acetylmuramate--alanine ligase
MIAFNNIQSVYFLGIGGIGMSAIARYFNAKGIHVSGYDKTPSELTNTLIAEGIAIHFEDSIDLLNPKADLVIYTPAIPKEHLQMNWYLSKGFTLYKRAQVLGMISKESFCIAVAGSHGKTTVSSMIAHILHENGGCTAFLGGIATNFQSNYIQSSNKYVVVEADEYDRSFLTLSPNIAVITAIDSDHLEIYGNLENIENEFIHFAQKMEENGMLILQENYQHIENRLPKSLQVFHYGKSPQSDFYLKNYKVNEGVFTFSIQTKDTELTDCKAHFGGIHNLENATAASAVCKILGLLTRPFKNLY